MENQSKLQKALEAEKETSSSEVTQNMASSPDRLQDFDSEKQRLWQQHSQVIIQELSACLFTFPNKKPKLRTDIGYTDEMLLTQTGCAYVFLASKRREIAKLLKQGPLRHQFGLFNKPGFASTDQFNLIKHLPSQKENVYKQLIALTREAPTGVNIHRRVDEEKQGIIYTITIKIDPERLKHQHEANLKSPTPFLEDNDTDLTIIFHDYGLDNPQTSIQIDHNPTPFAANYCSNSSYFHVQFLLIEPYMRECLAWTKEKELSEFLKNAGRIAYLLSHLQPVGRGNSAIVEWMIRTLAQIKQIELGPFNADEKIGWDFKAFLTPHVEEYATWFATKAFKTCEVINHNDVTMPGKK